MMKLPHGQKPPIFYACIANTILTQTKDTPKVFSEILDIALTNVVKMSTSMDEEV
jgi:hypothetical protein